VRIEVSRPMTMQKMIIRYQKFILENKARQPFKNGVRSAPAVADGWFLGRAGIIKNGTVTMVEYTPAPTSYG
jgi:hypothetical protein